MKDMPFYGEIKDHIFRFFNEKVFCAYVRTRKDGNYTLTLSKTTQTQKTREQLGYYYAVIVPTAFRQMRDDGNDSILICVKDRTGQEPHKFKELALTEDVVDRMLKEVWAKTKGVDVKSKADMTLEECSDLIDISIRWCARYLGCNIPPPEKTITNTQEVKDGN